MDRQVIVYGESRSSIYINPRTQRIEIPEPIEGETLYHAVKEAWRDNDTLIKYPFPIRPIIPPNVYSFIDGWELLNIESKHNLRDCAWKVYDINFNVIEEWAFFKLMYYDKLLPGSIYYRYAPLPWNKLEPRMSSEKLSKCWHTGFSIQILPGDLEFFIIQDDHMSKISNWRNMIGAAEAHCFVYYIPVFLDTLLDYEV